MTKVEYVSCIMCGKTVAKNKFKAEAFTIDPSEFIVLQVREQVGGRLKQGFFNIPEEGKTIKEMLAGSDDEREIAQVLKDRLLTVVESYVKAGIIKRSELKFPKAGGE